MNVVYDAFEGRYSDNPRALYQRMARHAGPGDRHLWLGDPRYADGFPRDVATVPHGTPAARAALEAADLVIANTHLDLPWDKKPGAVYLQTWHGTPSKRIHHDVLRARVGILSRLDLDVATRSSSGRSATSTTATPASGWSGSSARRSTSRC